MEDNPVPICHRRIGIKATTLAVLKNFTFFHVAPFTGLLALSSIKDLTEKVMAFSV